MASEIGSWSIAHEVVDYIRSVLPVGSTILEFGSGEGTGLLAEHYNMISIEHDAEYVDKYKSTYIHAPLVKIKPHSKFGNCDTWYDAKVIQNALQDKTYDMMMIDGPPGANITRPGMYKYRDMFNWKVPVIFDDSQNAGVWQLIVTICKWAEIKKVVTYNTDRKKAFSVL